MMRSGLVDCGEGVRLERGVPCPMPDGVMLYSDHYYPPDFEVHKHPTLLMRQPYGRDIASTVVYAHPVWFARQGYNVVIQDVRGRGDSEGEFYPFRHEGQDGAATIAFVRSRPECNGRVGMYGFSYQGMTQLLAAAEEPKGLQCIAPAMTAHDLYEGWFYCHGAMRLASSLGWGLQMLKEDARRLKLRDASNRLERAWANLPAQYLETPYGEHPAIHAEGLPSYVRDWMKHDAPGLYWQAMDISRKVARIRIPALHVSGWYDTYLKGSVAGFKAMRAHAGSAEAREQQYLVAGPWVHIPWGDRIGSHSFGDDASLDTDALLLRWFNHWLKDTNEFAGEPRIRHFALNENKWHDATDWPATDYSLYLKSAGRANSTRGDGLLSEAEPQKSEAPDIFVYDPEVPVAAPGGTTATAGPTNQAALELGNNVLVYTTGPLTKPLHILGSPEIALYAATSAPAADMVVKLVCVRPGGEALFVCIGIARSSYLFGDNYSADAEHLWTFSLEPTSWVFGVGDRVRVEIASSAYPLYDRNSSTSVAARVADSWNWKRSTQTVFHDAGRASAIRLPVCTGRRSVAR
jgi:putative CocE/NonD family hydrolase